MIKRARSEELGSLELFDGISKISFGCSVPSDIFRQSDNASWKRCLQALPTGQENTECHSESSISFRDCAQQKRQARLWVFDSRKPGNELQRGRWAFTRPKSPMPLKNLIKQRQDAIPTVGGNGNIDACRLGRGWGWLSSSEERSQRFPKMTYSR